MKTWAAIVGSIAVYLLTACADNDNPEGSGAGAAGSGLAGRGGGGGVVAMGAGGSGMGGADGSDGSADAQGNAGAGGLVDASADRAEVVTADVAGPDMSVDDRGPSADALDAAADGDGATTVSLDSDGPGALPRFCAELCTTDDDCARDSGVQATRCHPTTRRCSTCLDDTICIASRSLWTGKKCTLDADCVNEGGFSPFGDVCVDVDGTGYCAFYATSTTSCMSFLNTFSTFTIKKFGSEDRVDVCGKPSRCDAVRGSCQNPCTSNTSCTPARGGKVCNTGVGRCECATDGDCGPGAPTCNLAVRQCECGAQADCASDTGRILVCQ
jgi:hypothetical protein